MPVVNGISEPSYRENDRFFGIWMDMRVSQNGPTIIMQVIRFSWGVKLGKQWIWRPKIGIDQPTQLPNLPILLGVPQGVISFICTNKQKDAYVLAQT